MFKKFISNKKIKIVLGILGALIIVKGFSSTVFLADSPTIHPMLIIRLANTPQTIFQLPARLLARLGNLKLSGTQQSIQPVPTVAPPNELVGVEQITPPVEAVLQTISAGVYAGKDPITRRDYIKVDAGTTYRIIGVVTINGKEYPKIEFVE